MYAFQSILVVDDTDYYRDLFALLLRRAGLTVFVADSGQEALKLIHSKQPDVVLTDLMMPDMNGYELLAAIKANQHSAHLPVIVCSAMFSTKDMPEPISRGACSALPKPFTRSDLESSLKRCFAN